MRLFICILSIFVCAFSEACIEPTGKYYTSDIARRADSIFIGDFLSSKELPSNEDENPDDFKISDGPMYAVEFEAKRIIFGSPPRIFEVDICFSDFRKNQNYIIMSFAGKILAYAEYDDRVLEKILADRKASVNKRL